MVEEVYPTPEQFSRAHEQGKRPVDVAEQDLEDYLKWKEKHD